MDESLLNATLARYRKSDSTVQALATQLPEDVLSDFVQEVLARVRAQARQCNTSVDRPPRERVERLCHALISDDHEEGQRFIESIYEDGASLEAIYLNYLAEAAVILGEWWETDDASFYEVSIGTARMYAIVRSLSHLFVPERPVKTKSAVFASIPGETHNLGIRMAADLFGREGWDIHLIIGKSHADLVAEISRSNCHIIGLSAGGGHAAHALARLVIALRISNPRAAIVLSGQIARDAEDIFTALDVDGIVRDVPSALTLFDALWEDATADA